MSLLEEFLNKNGHTKKFKKSSSSLLKTQSWISWQTGIEAPTGMVAVGDYIYISNYENGTVCKVTISTGDIDYNWADGFYGTFGLATDGTYLYVANQGETFDANYISRVNLATASVEVNWATLTYNGPAGLAVYGSHLYVALLGDLGIPNTVISRINLSDPTIINSDWMTGLNGPFDLLVHGSYMYVSNFVGNTVSRINLSTNSLEYGWAAEDLFSPAGLTTDGTYLYVGNYSNGTISKFNLTTGALIDPYWSSFEASPFFILINASYFYLSLFQDGLVLRSNFTPPNPTPTPTPVSYICFPANTPVHTDQGIIEIDKIDPNKHTINNKPIVDITKTVTNDKYLVCFNKNALALNYPSSKTIMSKNHKIYFNGKMIEAYKFTEFFDDVFKIKYNGEILYNVLMEEHTKINVNNLLCETLHPDNIIAKLYTRKCKYSQEIKETIIALLNKCIEKNDYKTYKKIVKRIK